MFYFTIEEKQAPWLCRHVDKGALAVNSDHTASRPTESDQAGQSSRIISIPVPHCCMECVQLLAVPEQRLTVDGEGWYISTLPCVRSAPSRCASLAQAALPSYLFASAGSGDSCPRNCD